MIPTSYRWALGLLLAATLALWTQPAAACKCKLASVEEAKETAVALFEGRVLEVIDVADAGPAGERRVTLSVVRTWRGLENTERVTVRTAGSSATCGYMFEPDHSYLVYAGGNEHELWVSGCSRTRPMEDAAEDLAALGGGVTPVKVEPQPDASTKTFTKTRSAGCASSTGQASASLLFGLPALGLILRRRR